VAGAVGAGFDRGEPVGLGDWLAGVADDVHAAATTIAASAMAGSRPRLIPDRRRSMVECYGQPADDPMIR